MKKNKLPDCQSCKDYIIITKMIRKKWRAVALIVKMNNITNTRGKKTCFTGSTAQMLSKPLAPPSVFGSVNKRVWGPIVSAPWPKKPPSVCWCPQIERLWFFLFFSQWSGTFPLSSTHFLCEALSLRWVLLATDIGLSWGAVIITPTVPEHEMLSSTWCVN